MYALYKGDELLAFGSIDEIAKATGVTSATIIFYGSAAHKKRTGKKGRVLIKIEDD